MSKKSLEKNWREWSPETSDRQGRERDLEDYEGYLGFKRENLNGKTILDLGSGETELFLRELKNSGIDANVISLNPDYSIERFRKTMEKIPNWQKKSVAAIGQELPFKDEIFDQIFALYSITIFSNPNPQFGNPEAARHWMSEIIRVLKPGGEARLAPISAFKEQEVWEGQYKELLNVLKERGFILKVEMIKNKEIGLTKVIHSWIDEEGKDHEEIEDRSEDSHQARLIIKKPEDKISHK